MNEQIEITPGRNKPLGECTSDDLKAAAALAGGDAFANLDVACRAAVEPAAVAPDEGPELRAAIEVSLSRVDELEAQYGAHGLKPATQRLAFLLGCALSDRAADLAVPVEELLDEYFSVD